MQYKVSGERFVEEEMILDFVHPNGTEMFWICKNCGILYGNGERYIRKRQHASGWNEFLGKREGKEKHDNCCIRCKEPMTCGSLEYFKEFFNVE